MAMRNKSVIIFVVMVVVLAIGAIVPSLATMYTVGDAFGWQPPNGGFSYSQWAGQHSFQAGDILIFNFITGQHTATQVTPDNYNNCNGGNPISNQVTGPANYTLFPGTSYFICTVSNHCGEGQKLTINVASNPSYPSNPYGSNPYYPYTPYGYGPYGYGSAPPSAAVAAPLIFASMFMAFFI